MTPMTGSVIIDVLENWSPITSIWEQVDMPVIQHSTEREQGYLDAFICGHWRII